MTITACDHHVVLNKMLEPCLYLPNICCCCCNLENGEVSETEEPPKKQGKTNGRAADESVFGATVGADGVGQH